MLATHPSKNGRPVYQVDIVEVTPERAARWLSEQGPNRSLSASRVDSLAHDMRNGGWGLSPQGLVFDVHGRLRDGQHRLSAVIQSGVTIQMYVFRNVPEHIVPLLDLGKNRSAADSILMETGDKFAAKKAAIASVMVMIERGTTCRMSPLLCKSIIAAIGEDHVNATCEYAGARLPAVAQATFAYVRPIHPSLIDALADRLMRREVRPGVEVAMFHVLGRHSTQKNERHATALKFLRGLQFYILGQNVEKLQETDQGVLWARAQRSSLGMPSTVVPEDFRLSAHRG